MTVVYTCGVISDVKGRIKNRQANTKQIPRRQDNGFIFTVKKELEKYQDKMQINCIISKFLGDKT